jgi:hypothetical protein
MAPVVKASMAGAAGIAPAEVGSTREAGSVQWVRSFPSVLSSARCIFWVAPSIACWTVPA